MNLIGFSVAPAEKHEWGRLCCIMPPTEKLDFINFGWLAGWLAAFLVGWLPGLLCPLRSWSRREVDRAGIPLQWLLSGLSLRSREYHTFLEKLYFIGFSVGAH